MVDFKIAKIDPVHQFVFGWASVAKVNGQEVVDHQSHIIETEELEMAVYDYNLNYRNADERHTREVKGKLIESFIVTPLKLESMGLQKDALPEAWWVGFHIFDKEAFDKVVNGDYTMFSIEGTARPEPILE